VEVAVKPGLAPEPLLPLARGRARGRHSDRCDVVPVSLVWREKKDRKATFLEGKGMSRIKFFFSLKFFLALGYPPPPPLLDLFI